MLKNQLGDSVPNSYFEVRIAEVEKENSDRASIIRIDDTGANVEAELGSESAARSEAAISTFRDSQRDLSVDESLASSGDSCGLGAV